MTQPAAFLSHPGISFAPPATNLMPFQGTTAPWGGSTFFVSTYDERYIRSSFEAYGHSIPFQIADETGTRLNPAALSELEFIESAETTAERGASIPGQIRLLQCTNAVIMQMLGNLQPDELARARMTCRTFYILSSHQDVIKNSLRLWLPSLQLRSPCMFSFHQQLRIIFHYVSNQTIHVSSDLKQKNALLARIMHHENAKAMYAWAMTLPGFKDTEMAQNEIQWIAEEIGADIKKLVAVEDQIRKDLRPFDNQENYDRMITASEQALNDNI
jgi:hypothetical protein